MRFFHLVHLPDAVTGAVLFLLLGLAHAILPAPAAAECDGFSLDLGIGVHDPAFDGPEYTTQNALGIIEARYQLGALAAVFSHTSSMEGFPRVWDSPNEYGYGANVLSLRYRFGAR